MELLNREFQRELLTSLAAIYPGDALVSSLPGYGLGNQLVVNAAYLSEHGLMEARLHQMDGRPQLGYAKITANGMDFLQDDGGLGAILGVVTIRLHEETIRALLIDRVRESDADDTVKGRLIDQLKSLPAEAASKLAERALDQALRYMPNAIQWLQTAPWS